MAAKTWSDAARGARVHQHHAIRADLHTDVSAGPGDHVEVRPNPHDVKLAAVRFGGVAGDRADATTAARPA